jgi:hypothetical protein
VVLLTQLQSALAALVEIIQMALTVLIHHLVHYSFAVAAEAEDTRQQEMQEMQELTHMAEDILAGLVLHIQVARLELAAAVQVVVVVHPKTLALFQEAVVERHKLVLQLIKHRQQDITELQGAQVCMVLGLEDLPLALLMAA